MKMDCLPKNRFLPRYFYVSFWIIGAILICSSLGQEVERVNSVNVTCDYANITASIIFPNIFKGVVFTEGGFFNPYCKFYADNGTTDMQFVLPLTECGNHIREIDDDLYVFNNIVVQNHPIVQTDSDEVHKASCKLPRPDTMLQQEFIHESHPISFLSADLEAYMNFKFGGDILGLDISNKLLVGDEFQMVVHVKDGGKYKDFQVEKCWAYEGETIPTSRYVLKMHDMFNCRNEWIYGFNFSKGVENVSDTIAYGTIKAFKFPSSKNLHLTCSIQACTDTCYRYCDTESERSNHYSRRYKRSPYAIPNRSHRERHRLMKATIKALGTKLMDRRNGKELSENDVDFRRRSEKGELLTTTKKYEDVDDNGNSTEIIFNETYTFNVTNNVAVFIDYDFNFKREYCSSSLTVTDDCISKLKFGIVTASLSFTIFCLILICIGFMLHIRKENKRHRIDNFLLYNLC